MFSYVNPMSTEVNTGKYLVEACGKVLVTSEYTDYGQNQCKVGPTDVPSITCEISAITCRALQNETIIVLMQDLFLFSPQRFCMCDCHVSV